MDPKSLRAELERRIARDPVKFSVFNPAQKRIFSAASKPDTVVLIAAMGNGTGKTYGVVALWSAIMFGTANPLFDHPIFKAWPYPKVARITTTSAMAADNSPLQRGMKDLFPMDGWWQKKGPGGYYSIGGTEKGWAWDLKTHNQQELEAAGETVGLHIYIEPPPKGLFDENVARGRAGCLHAMDITPLNYAPWIKDDLVDAGALKAEDGTVLGQVVAVHGTIEDNCADHNEGGQLPHFRIQQTIALYTEEERDARVSGGFMHLAGRIYSKYGDQNRITQISGYHDECWERGKVNLSCVMDPHDRKAWAIGWFATFPNEDVIGVAECPNFNFARTRSCTWQPDDYRRIILATEKELGLAVTRRLIDPNFGNSPKLGGATVKVILAGACLECREKDKKAAICPHSLMFEDAPDDIENGHLLVRAAVGDAGKGIRPKLYTLDTCPNMDYGMRHYGYKEHTDATKGLSTTPELVHKDFPDLWRYGFNAGFDKYVDTRPQRWVRRAPLRRIA